GSLEGGAEIAGAAERLAGEALGAFRHQRDVVAGCQAAGELDRADPRAGHARADHVLAVVGDPHRTSHSRASRYPSVPFPMTRCAQTSSSPLTRRQGSRRVMSEICTSTTRSFVAATATRSA